MYEKREKANKDRTSALEKALSDGLEQGIEKGIEQGMEQCIEQGLEQGIEQGVISVAKKLKASGSPIQLIEQATGLTQAQIERL